MNFISTVRGASPFTLISSRTTFIGSQAPLNFVWLASAGFVSSTTVSTMSMPAKVKAHAIVSLLPASTPTNGGSEPPMTFQPGDTRCTKYRSDGISIVRCGSLATIGTPVVESLPLTTQLLLPSMSCSSGATRATLSGATRSRYCGTISRFGNTPGANGLPSPLRTTSRMPGGMLFTSRPSGTVSSSHGSGAASALAAFAPFFATSRASRSSSSGVPLALSRPICAQRSVSVLAVHGSGVRPVSWNSTGRLSLCCVT